MNARGIIEELLGEREEYGLVDRYAHDPKPLLREMGVIFNETSLEIFDAVYGDEFPHVVVCGPRGGGKTFLITLALGCRFVLKRDDVFHLGGSEEQAKNGFRYISEFVTGAPALAEFVADDLKTAATTRWGNWYKIAACSGKRVRGPHCGDPHAEMGWQPHGGCCYTDEEAEIPDEIVDAMRFVVNTAEPRKRVRSSTAHKVGGRFKQVIGNPGRFGAKLLRYDIIDVVSGCEYDCACCPMGYYFAGALMGGRHGGKGTKGTEGTKENAAFAGARWREAVGVYPTEASAKGWEDWKRENNFPEHESALCGGRAKLHDPGHVAMENVFEDVRSSQNRSSDEVELFGRDRAAGGLVLDPVLLEQCLVWDARWEGGYEAIACVDWGWNWSVIVVLQMQMGRCVVCEVVYSRHQLIGEIRETFERLRDEYGIWHVTADASHKRENAEVASWGFAVEEVAFAQAKDFGVRWLKGMVERRQLAIPGRVVAGSDPVGQEGKYEFGSSGHKTFFEQCMAWHAGPDGKIVKLNDHGPDAALTGAVLLSAPVEWSVSGIQGTGERESWKI